MKNCLRPPVRVANYSSRSPARLRAGGTLVCLLAIYFFIAQTPASGTTTILALTGDPSPDVNGTYANFFSNPAADNQADDGGFPFAAFHAGLEGTIGGLSDNQGIFIETFNTIRDIARKGQTAPDGNGTYAVFGSPVVPDIPRPAFKATLVGTVDGSNDNEGIFVGEPDRPVTLIVRSGHLAPNGNGTFFSFSPPAIDDGLNVTFSAFLIDTSDDQGIFQGNGGPLTTIARKGQSAPDGNGEFSSLSFFGNPARNHLSQAVFFASLSGTSGGATDNSGIFLGDGGPVATVARAGQPAPDGNGSFFGFGAPVLDRLGKAAFSATLVGTSGGPGDNQGVYLGAPGGPLTTIARKGQFAPDGFGRFSSFPNVAVNDGKVVFDATLSSTTLNAGIFVGDGTTLETVVRKGQAAPDGNGTFVSFGSPVLNEVQQVVFRGFLTGTSGGATEGIFLANGDDIIQVARIGDPLSGSTITELSFDPSRGAAGGSHISYLAFLADGRQAIVRFSVNVNSVPVPGDYNGNGVVDAADYVMWRDSFGKTGADLPADSNGDGEIDIEDYLFWRDNFSKTSSDDGSAHGAAVPEPMSLALLVIALAGLVRDWTTVRRRRRNITDFRPHVFVFLATAPFASFSKMLDCQ